MKKLTTDEFIDKARNVHADKYEYVTSKYVNARTKIEITCKLHGTFLQMPSMHLSGQGCPKCGNSRKQQAQLKPFDEVLKKFTSVHKDRYQYIANTYKNSKTPMDIICSTHGVFKQAPYEHVNGSNCPACASTRKYTLDLFLDKAYEVHGDRYDYTTTTLASNSKTPISITCKEHGIFNQSVLSHLAGRGCPQCKTSGYRVDKPGYFYLLKLCNYPNLYKVGITNRSVSKRFTKEEQQQFDTLIVKRFEKGRDCLDLETKVLQVFAQNRNNSYNILKTGNSEILNLTTEEYQKLWALFL